MKKSEVVKCSVVDVSWKEGSSTLIEAAVAPARRDKRIGRLADKTTRENTLSLPSNPSSLPYSLSIFHLLLSVLYSHHDPIYTNTYITSGPYTWTD